MLQVIRIHALLIAWSLVVSNVSAQEPEKPVQAKCEMLIARILVLDPDGHPLDGATVVQSGLRARANPGGLWHWNADYHGPRPKVNTNAEGIAEVPYPKYVSKNLETGQVSWSVEHPEYVPFLDDRYVDDDPAEIRLKRGFRVAVAAVNRDSGEPITTDLFATINSHPLVDWKLHDNGMLVSPTFEVADSMLRVMQMVEGQPALYSELIEIKPEGRSRVLLEDVKLAAGTRVEGRLDDSVPRPVKNGYVVAMIVKGTGSGNFGPWEWNDKAPIADDGTFVFDSLPSHEVLQLIPFCDDWTPKMPSKDSVLKYFPENVRLLEMEKSLPHLIELSNEVVRPVLEMEPAASVRVVVTDATGNPLPNTIIAMSPNQRWFNYGSQILGSGISTREILIATRKDNYNPDWSSRYSETTDQNGIAVIRNLPANRPERIRVWHDDFELPILEGDRSVTVELKPGEVSEIKVQLEEKWTEGPGAVDDEVDD